MAFLLVGKKVQQNSYAMQWDPVGCCVLVLADRIPMAGVAIYMDLDGRFDAMRLVQVISACGFSSAKGSYLESWSLAGDNWPRHWLPGHPAHKCCWFMLYFCTNGMSKIALVQSMFGKEFCFATLWKVEEWNCIVLLCWCSALDMWYLCFIFIWLNCTFCQVLDRRLAMALGSHQRGTLECCASPGCFDLHQALSGRSS